MRMLIVLGKMNILFTVFVVLLIIVILTGNHFCEASPSKAETSGVFTTDKTDALRNYHCGTVDFEICDTAVNGSKCALKNSFILWNASRDASEVFENASRVLNVYSGRQCHLTLCSDEYRMGYCLQFPPGVKNSLNDFKHVLQPGLLGVHCKCSNESLHKNIPYSGEKFDRNYVGVVYSPYDKYWEPTGPNGTLRRVSWRDYSADEMTQTLKKISENFTLISTFGMGTASNTSEWYEGDKSAYVPILSAGINQEVGYLALRVSIGIFRKDDVNLEWKSKELYNAIDAAKVANEKFNGTVWGITVTSDYVTDSYKASDAIEMIEEVKRINVRDHLHLKVGIRLKTCFEFIANQRPEDESVPAYTQDNPYTSENTSVKIVALTSFQSSLHKIAQISDYILCNLQPPPTLVVWSFANVTKIMQNRFVTLRETLRLINPKLKLIIETGVPSQGVGNAYKNSLENLRDYWFSMAEFSKREHIMFHMFEAIDQPWKNVYDGSNNRLDLNGPNGADAHFGWWKRLNNSEPPVYIEKISEIKPMSRMADPETWLANNKVEIVILCFIAFAIGTVSVVFYLWWKLRKAKTQVISQTYVDQFMSGGDVYSVDENYAVALRIPYDRKYELAKGTFEIDKSAVMGSGQSGIVCRGKIQCLANPVAFKCTTPRSTVVDIKAIMSEIKILSYIGQHDNLVCLLGAYTKKIQRGIVYVALEYCELGNAEAFLKKADFKETVFSCSIYENDPSRYVTLGKSATACNPGYVADLSSITGEVGGLGGEYVAATDLTATLTVQPNKNTLDMLTLLKWSRQIASAMDYISGMGVVHADLAARNILIASMDKVKVSDFGLSRKMYQEMGVTHDKDTPLPWRWMAPESLKHLAFSSQSDVWAYGVTVWELFSFAEVPYHGTSYDMQFAERIIQGMRLPMAEYATDHIHEMLEKCWKVSASERPCFKELERTLTNLIEEYSLSQKERWV